MASDISANGSANHASELGKQSKVPHAFVKDVLDPGSKYANSGKTPSAWPRRHFTVPGVSPYDQIEWRKRACSISDPHGRIIFSQEEVEAPVFWSTRSLNIVASRYLHGEEGSVQRESSIRQLISRVVETIADWGLKDGYFGDITARNVFRDELAYLLLNQRAAFNSPVWFNVGVQPTPQCSACFILSVDDSMDSLLELQKVEGMLFKYGSGTGTNLSSIRSSKEKLAGGGTPSGPVSFMRGFDAWAGTIKSGGKTRRAAKMQILNADHPDIREFVLCKQKEEKKAWALIEAGYDGSFAASGGAYESVAFQNANLSVRASDDFMRAAKEGRKFWTLSVKDGKPCEEIDAAEILNLIAEGTYICGDPGMQFDTTINAWHTCPNSGRINSSNPCSEYMHLDNSACNLASLNLLPFLSADGQFDIDGFCHSLDVILTAQDILIDNSGYPTAKIGETARRFRQLGLGYANLGAALMCKGLPYDSDRGRAWAAAVTALMSGQAYLTSANLAAQKRAFEGFALNREPMIAVIEKHRDAARALVVNLGQECSGLDCNHDCAEIAAAAEQRWEAALEQGARTGFRNSQTTVLAPTGTIAFMMDCDTTGVEPDIALVKYKSLSDGGSLKIVNNSVERALRVLGYENQEIAEILDFVNQHETIEGAPHLREEDLEVFDCAFKPRKGKRSIGYLGHLKMMAALQPFISGAISKTVNLPGNITTKEISDIYIKAWEMGIKAVALYRDGSKRTQPLSTSRAAEQAREKLKPVRRRLDPERKSITHKFSVAGLEGYVTVGLYSDGSPGEVFLVVAKEGSTLSGIMDAFATSISLALQYGVPLVDLVRKFSHVRFEPSGFTSNPEIPIAKSIIDYVFRWLGLKFLTEAERMELGLVAVQGNSISPAMSLDKSQNNAGKSMTGPQGGQVSGSTQLSFENSLDAPPCLVCGSSMMVRQAGCYVCLNCGAQGGCG